jgi:glutamine amidotransferase
MCRWIAYRGPTIALEHYVTEPAHSLVSQSVHALESTASTNGDGFGLGWYGEHPEPGLYREIRPAWSDENLRYLCRHLRSHLFFAHVRAATGTPITRPNCHPFACAGSLFMHNGFVGSWSRLRRQVEALIPDELYPARAGTTDSEAVFLAIMGAGARRDPVAAASRILHELTRLMNQGGYSEKLRFTAALADGRDLYAFRYAVNDHANSLYFRESEDGVVIVSEPLDREHANWQAVPENRVVIARHGKRVEVLPFLEGGAQTYLAAAARAS